MSRSLSQYQITYLNGPMGLVATGRRDINTGNEFDAYYPVRQPKEEYVMVGNSYNTLDLMVERIAKDHREASKIAAKLYSPDLKVFTKRIFDHIYQNFQYKQDPSNREQVKGVAGSYANRISGIDCDDMAFLAGTMLYNKGIPFAIRKTSKNDYGDFSHVYLVVPKSAGLSLKKRSNYYVIDPVLDQNDFEYPKNKVPQYYDEVLVTPNNNKMNGIACDCDTLNGVEDYNLATKAGWENLRADILSGSELVPGGHDEVDFIEKTNLLISAWDDPEVREYVIAVLLVDEELSENGLQGMEGLFKKTFKKIKRAGKAVGKTVKKVSRVARKAAPPLLLAREGIKLWFRKIGRKKAASLWVGYYSEQQAKAKKINLKDWRRRVDRRKKVEKLFKSIGGKGSKLQDAIYDGAKSQASRKSWFIDKNTVLGKRSTSSSRKTTSRSSSKSTTSARSNYLRFKRLYDTHKRAGRNSTANRYAGLANKYAKSARQPVLPLLSAFSVGPRPTSKARPQRRPVIPIKMKRKVSPAPPRRKPPTRNNNLAQYNKYKSLNERYRKSNPTLANRYADMANRYARSAGRPPLRKLNTKPSRPVSRRSTPIRRISTPSRRSTSTSRSRVTAKRPNPLRSRVTTKRPAPVRRTTPSRTTFGSRSSALSQYNRYKSLYKRYERSNPTLANRYASLANRYAKSARQPILGSVSMTRALKSGLRGLMHEYTGMGEPVTVAATTAAAAPFIVKITQILKGLSDDPETVESVTKAVKSGAKKKFQKKLRKEVSKKSKKTPLVKRIKKELNKKPILKNTLKTITKKKPITSRPVTVNDGDKKRILSSFIRYNKARKRSWESTIKGHLNWSKIPANAKRDAKRATYAKLINYNPALAKKDALRFGLLQPKDVLEKAIKSKAIKKSTKTTSKVVPKVPASRTPVEQPKSIDGQLSTKMVLGGVTALALGTAIYMAASNKGKKLNGIDAEELSDTMNGPKKTKKPAKPKKEKKTTIVIQ